MQEFIEAGDDVEALYKLFRSKGSKIKELKKSEDDDDDDEGEYII